MDDKPEFAKVPEPSKLEVEIAIEKLSEAYHRTFTYDDASRFITLNRELKIWQSMEKDLDEGKAVTRKDVINTQKIYKESGERLSKDQAMIKAKKGLLLNIAKNVLRITNELEELLK
jgi:hypothetical protein